MINFFTQAFPPELKSYYDSMLSSFNLFDPSNTDQGGSVVEINAKSGLALFTDSVPANGYKTFSVNNTFVTTSDKKIRCDLYYNASSAGSVGKPSIVFVDAFEGAEYFNIEVKNESTTDATDGTIEIVFQFLN